MKSNVTRPRRPSERLLASMQALSRALWPQPDMPLQAQLLEHFPFARLGERRDAALSLRIPTTVHGSL